MKLSVSVQGLILRSGLEQGNGRKFTYSAEKGVFGHWGRLLGTILVFGEYERLLQDQTTSR
jgi:hypothetical protein